MPRYKMVVLSNPLPGRAQECDDWYQNIHLHDMVKLAGFKSAQLHQLANTIAEPNPYRYFAVYEIDTDDIDSAIMALTTAAESGSLLVSESLDSEHAYAVVYDDGGEVVCAK